MELTRICLGTYLGAVDADADASYADAARAYMDGGGNLFDTAANYRGGRSKAALGSCFQDRERNTFFVSTKTGYLPMGEERSQETSGNWFQRILAGPGILAPEDVADGCHAMTPRYPKYQLGVSLAALRLERVDVLHVHNPEQQFPVLGRAAFRVAVRKAFGACE